MRVTRAEALDGVRRARVGRMATITPEGRPHVVPFVFVLIGEDPDLHAYWVVDRKQRRWDVSPSGDKWKVTDPAALWVSH